MRTAPLLAAALAVVLLTATDARADWPQWRGPHFNGSADDTGLPVAWTKTENIAWATDMPGPSSATPSVTDNRIFVTALDEDTLDLLALCVDRRTGKRLWSHANGKGRTGPRVGFENSRAECSPVANAEIVCFVFGSGLVVTYDHAGKELWQRDLVGEFGPIDLQWGYGSSPLLIDGMIVVQVLRNGESYLIAFEAKSGHTRWKHTRTDDAHAESEQAYTSPIPFDNAGRTEILVLGADCLTSHDPATGREHWRWSDLNPNKRGNFRAITNPVAGRDGFVYVTSPQGNPLHAIRVRGNEATEVWTLRKSTPDVCTPLFYRDRLYVIDGRRRRKMMCLDPGTGAPHWEQELDTPTYIRSSPTAADGKIYIMDAEGFVNTVAAADEFRLLGQANMDAYPSRASIAIDGGQLLVRTADRLYCVGADGSRPAPVVVGDRAAGAAAITERVTSRPSAGRAERDRQRWPSFRGAHARGTADGYDLPVEWDVTTGVNIAWRTPMPGLAHSSPIVWDDRVYVTSAEKARGDDDAELKVGLYGSIGSVDEDVVHRFKVHCLDTKTGELTWSRTAHQGVPAVKRHPKSSHATCTPATDGRHVIAFFGSEGLYCFDRDGTLLWERDLGTLDAGFYMVKDAQWGFGSSPVIHENMVLIQCDVQEGSFVAALNLADGTDVWRTDRDDVPTWGSPTVDVRDGRSQVIVNGYRHIGGYDLHTGTELWKLVGGGDIPVPTPIVAHDSVFITNAHGRMAPIYAIDPMVSGTIDPENREQVRWMVDRRGNYMQTPIVYGDLLYCCNDAGILSCYDAKSGESIYRERLGSGQTGFSASLVAGDGKLYATSEYGEVIVVKTGRDFEVLAVNELGETCMASPAIVEGTLFFRTRGHVVAVRDAGK